MGLASVGSWMWITYSQLNKEIKLNTILVNPLPQVEVLCLYIKMFKSPLMHTVFSGLFRLSAITFAVFKNTVTFPCTGDCDCKRRHIHMFSPLLFPPLLPYSPTSWHLLRQEGLIIFPLHRLTHFITLLFFKILPCCPCLQCLHCSTSKYNSPLS